MLKVLWTAEYNKYWNSVFEEKFDLKKESCALYEDGRVVLPDGQTDPKIIEAIKDRDVLIVGYDIINKEVLKNAPKLKLILSGRDGPEENVDIAACTELGIPVIAAGGRCATNVAETILTQMFLLAKPIIAANQYLCNGQWKQMASKELNHFFANTTELYGKTLGLIGFGANGKALTQKVSGLNMEVLVYDPYVSQEQIENCSAKKIDSMEELVKAADYVVMLARLTESNKHMFGKKEFKTMKNTAFFINSARSRLVDMDALMDAYENKQIAGVALDVFDNEPLPLDSREMSLIGEKFILTPHIAGVSVERLLHQYELLNISFEKFLQGDFSSPIKNREVLNSVEFKNRGAKLINK